MAVKKFNWFIGIDVSRNELDYAVIKGKEMLFHREEKNTPESITAFVKELKTLQGFTMSKSVFCMENTGIYCNHLLATLKKLKGNVAVENALQIKNSLGLIRGKNDKVDAIRIALYAEKNRDHLRMWQPRRAVLEQLAFLVSLRNRMMILEMTLRTPLKEQKSFIKKGTQKQSVQLCVRSVAALRLDLEEIELAIDQVIESDETINKIYKQIISVYCMGRMTAIHIIISTNEFRDISSPKKFACYAGVAPFKKESGIFKGRSKVSQIANKKIKSLLHICALNAIRWDSELKTYYERKTKVEGKHKMAVINAVRYKLILRAFACVNQDRLFQKEYTKELQQVG